MYWLLLRVSENDEAYHTPTRILSSAANSIVRSLSRAAHLRSVATSFVTRSWNVFRSLTITVSGALKSNTSGDRSTVKRPHAARLRLDGVAASHDVDAGGRSAMAEQRLGRSFADPPTAAD